MGFTIKIELTESQAAILKSALIERNLRNTGSFEKISITETSLAASPFDYLNLCRFMNPASNGDDLELSRIHRAYRQAFLDKRKSLRKETSINDWEFCLPDFSKPIQFGKGLKSPTHDERKRRWHVAPKFHIQSLRQAPHGQSTKSN